MKYIIKNINDIPNSTYMEFFNKLSKNKQNKINKKIDIQDKKRSLLGLILLEELIEEKINNLDIEYSKNGKPYLKNKNIYFNISHKKDYVITIISNKNIGVDIEYIDENKINKSTLKYFSTKTEEKNINNKELYFTIFSLKESYLKMKDILFDKNMIEFEINNNQIINNRKDINIKIINDIKNYIITICEENV